VLALDAPALEDGAARSKVKYHSGAVKRSVEGAVEARMPRAERLAGWIAAFPRGRVAVLGDLVADEFIVGDIVRVSREAPVLILEHRETLAAPGGGANSAANLRALGALPLPVGVVGRDEAGRRLLSVFRSRGIPTSGILRIDGYATPTKSRILAGGLHTRRQQVVRLDRGAARGTLPPAVLAWLRRALARALGRANGLLVADYGYGAASPELLRSVRRRASLPVTVDSRARVAAFGSVTACTPNQEEVERALARGSLAGDRAVEAAGRTLLRRTRNRAVLITRGAEGMSLFERGRRPLHLAAHGADDEVADVTGAGDTVIATFTLALIAGAGCADAAYLANVAAGLVVRKVGTATTDRQELTRAVRSVPSR
jgi:rfaE bifunctional protein kinase chain/domain